MNKQDRHSLFVELITCYQSELYGYIYAVVRNWQDTDDVYQSVCLILWSKFEMFRAGTNFFAWARQTARNKISEYLKHKQSPLHVTEKGMDVLSETAAECYNDEREAYLAALKRCKETLNATDNELLKLRYVDELSIIQIAKRLQRFQPSISRSLNRVRRRLYECVEMELVAQDHSSK
jgi:RNA polymerase sigma-70 factor, ECF subfamily